jgi:hypothetical protein
LLAQTDWLGPGVEVGAGVILIVFEMEIGEQLVVIPVVVNVIVIVPAVLSAGVGV